MLKMSSHFLGHNENTFYSLKRDSSCGNLGEILIEYSLSPCLPSSLDQPHLADSCDSRLQLQLARVLAILLRLFATPITALFGALGTRLPPWSEKGPYYDLGTPTHLLSGHHPRFTTSHFRCAVYMLLEIQRS